MSDREDAKRLRVMIDGGILSRPATGTARWVRGVAAALGTVRSLDSRLVLGPPLIKSGGRLHRVPNLMRERWWYEVALPRLARRERVDALLLPANLSARRTGIPQVVSMLDVNFLTQPGTYERTFVLYATWAYRRSLRDADRVTSLSRYSRSEIARHLDFDPARIDVVYPGLDEVSPDPIDGPPHERPYALYVGATERHKNVGLLVRAWRQGSPAGLDLVIVGQPGRDHQSVVEAAERCGRRVRVTGRVDRRELERWYRHASVFVFPSRVEGFGYPPLEAMQRGVPVVSSTGGSLPEILGDGARYFDPEDADGVRREVERVMGDNAERGRLLAASRAVTSKFTWARTAEAFAWILENMTPMR